MVPDTLISLLLTVVSLDAPIVLRYTKFFVDIPPIINDPKTEAAADHSNKPDNKL